MSFRRYIAANSREALAQIRRELGDDAVILSNRRVPDGVEVVAAASRIMDRIVQEAPATRLVPRARSGQAEASAVALAANTVAPPVVVATERREKKPQPLIHPEESFQEFVRRQSRGAQGREGQRAGQGPGRAGQQEDLYSDRGRAAPEPAIVKVAVAQRDDEMSAHKVDPQAEAALAIEDEWKPTTFHMPLSEGLSAGQARSQESDARPFAGKQQPARSAEASHGASSRVPTRWQSQAVASVIDRGGRSQPPAVFRRKTAAPAVSSASAASLPFATVASVATAPVASAPDNKPLLDELHALRDQLQKQLDALSSTVVADRRDLHQQITQSLSKLSAQSRQQMHGASAWLMSRLLMAGFSPMVARKLAQHVPAHMTVAQIDDWLHEVVALNLKVVDARAAIEESGGAYALVGPTGVGKTTTVAKLAARFAVRYGSGALGLITLDAYRVGAHDHLRAYGRILGAPVHLAQDAATLRELLVAMQNKRLVLIDSCGLSQRDGRLNEALEMIETANAGAPEPMRIQRVLLANAASHAETLDETARAWRASECAGCVLTKLDEAVRIGGALDTILRYKLRLFGVTNGQRVPEDYHAAHARVLTHMALRPSAERFALEGQESMAMAARGLAPA